MSRVDATLDVSSVVERAISDHARRPGGLLPLLHQIQDELGYLPQEIVPRVALAMHQSVAEVYGVIRFYHHFRLTPPGRHVLRVCLAESCQSMGAGRLLQHARDSLGVDLHQTTADGCLTLEPVYCLGNCACSPALMVDAELVGRVDGARFDAIVEQCRRPQ